MAGLEESGLERLSFYFFGQISILLRYQLMYHIDKNLTQIIANINI